MVSRFTYSEMRCTFRNKAYFNDALRYFQNAGTETRDSVRPAVLQPRKASRVRLFIYSERFERSSLHEYNIRRFRGCGSEGSIREKLPFFLSGSVSARGWRRDREHLFLSASRCSRL